MRRISRPAKLAVVVAVAAVAGVAGVPLSGAHGNITVTAQFDSAAGLYEGNPVSVLGMRVGKISSIATKGSHVDVTMRVDESVRIPADATAVAVSDSVLTERHIEFTPVYRSGPVLRDGTTLNLGHTRTPVEFDSVLAAADKLSTALAGDGRGNGPLAGLVDVGAAVTTNNGADIRRALDQLSQALRMGDDGGAATKNAVTQIVNNLNSLTAAAARNDQRVREFGGAVGQMSAVLADLNLGAGDTGKKMNEILLATTDLMEKNRATLASTASGANVMIKSLADYHRNLGEFLDLFPLVTDNAYNAMDQQAGAGRVHVNVDKVALDGQMIKEVCNLLNLKQLGCNTGKMSDMGPDFGVISLLAGIAGLPR